MKITEGFQSILAFKRYLQEEYPEYTEGNINLEVLLVKQQSLFKVDVQIDTSDINRFKITPIWENSGLSRERFKEMGLYGVYSMGYNYNFLFSEQDKTLTIFDNGDKILIFS